MDRYPDRTTGDEEAHASERTVVQLISEVIEANGGEVPGHASTLLAVSLEGSRPATTLVLRYRSTRGGEYHAHWPLWEDDPGDPPVGVYYAPKDAVSLVLDNVLDGSARAIDDPDRARGLDHADFAEHPHAAKVSPDVRDDAASWRDWERRFPEAAARRDELRRRKGANSKAE